MGTEDTILYLPFTEKIKIDSHLKYDQKSSHYDQMLGYPLLDD